MRKFLLKLLVFLILLYVSSALLQRLIDRGLKNDDSGIYKEWNDVYKSKINADILIQGSSRAYRHISPSIIDSAFKANSYNLGLSGYGFSMQYYRFLFYLEYNKTPQYIIQSVDAIMTFNKTTYLTDYQQFLPYLNDTIIQKAVTSYKEITKGLDWKDIYIPLYKYNSLPDIAYKGIVDNFRKAPEKNAKYKGFLPQNLHWDTAFESFKLHHPNGYRIEVDKEAVRLLEKFLDFCKAKKITVILVCTPEYYGAQKILLNRDSIMNIIENCSRNYHIPFLNYSNDSICLDTVNFYNSQHLNMLGVKKFNKKLVNDLKEILK